MHARPGRGDRGRPGWPVAAVLARLGRAVRDRRVPASLTAGAALLALLGCGTSGAAASPAAGRSGSASAGSGRPAAPGAASAGSLPDQVPAPAHTLVVVLENHSYAQIIGSRAAPFINSLARRGALLTRSYAITHPSEPNYLALFSGSTHGITDDGCPYRLSGPNLAADLIRAGKSFVGYAEGLPVTGSLACSAGEYARKHVPWTDFRNVPGSVSKPFTSFPEPAFDRLPTVSFVIPNLCHDMHSCDVAAGDSWLRVHIGGYASWAMSHHSLLILTWDENDGSSGNQIPTIFAGQMVRPGRYGEPVTHYSVLATIEAAYGLRRDGRAAAAKPITSIWRS
ncbi:MAG: alkaline phosphatase family protein [Streptosporangiaceae bacterium]|jgi:acid phosphatase